VDKTSRCNIRFGKQLMNGGVMHTSGALACEYVALME
jgi:hypothetical protein